MISVNNSCLATILMLQLDAFSFFPKRNQGGLDVHSSALEGVGRKRLLFPLRNKNPNAVIYISVIPEIS